MNQAKKTARIGLPIVLIIAAFVALAGSQGGNGLR
jgi:hypothetical protein